MEWLKANTVSSSGWIETMEKVWRSLIAQLYRQRTDSENVFDELQNQWGFARFCSQKVEEAEIVT